MPAVTTPAEPLEIFECPYRPEGVVLMVPFEFDFLWRLKQDGPSTAAEIAEILSRPQHSWPRTGRWVANQLRRLIAVGLVERCDDGTLGVYRLTDQGREYVDA